MCLHTDITASRSGATLFKKKEDQQQSHITTMQRCITTSTTQQQNTQYNDSHNINTAKQRVAQQPEDNTTRITIHTTMTQQTNESQKTTQQE